MKRKSVSIPGALVVLVFLSIGGWFARNAPPTAAGFRQSVARWADPDRERRAFGLGRYNVREQIGKRRVDFAVDFYGLRYRGNTGNFLDAELYTYGAYEKSELHFIRQVLSSRGPGSVFVDVGANTGQHSLFASKYSGQVHAFEPYPPVLARLRSAVEENHLSNVVVHPVGLGDGEAELPFFDPPDENLGTGSFVPGFSNNNNQGLKLRVVAGDAYFSSMNISRVDVIKMDIEGYEKAALAGLARTLMRSRPVVLVEISVFEHLPHVFRSLQEVTAAFPQNYEFFEMTDKDPMSGAYRLRPYRFPETGQSNVVARPKEDAAIVPDIYAGESR